MKMPHGGYTAYSTEKLTMWLLKEAEVAPPVRLPENRRMSEKIL